MAINEDLAEYAKAAGRHGSATVAGDADSANRAFHDLQRCWNRIRLNAPEWQSRFQALLSNEDPWVRLWAASHTLPLDPDLAVPVLEALSHEAGFLGFDARMTLQTWQKGDQGELTRATDI
jgi:hypothetical protein